MHTVGATAAILENGHILLVRRNDLPLWALPGGGLDDNETIAACCVREVKEETGLEVEIDRLVGLYARQRGFGRAMNLGFLFRCRAVGGALSTSDETSAVQYWPANGLPRNTVPWHRGFLSDALCQDPQTVWRTVHISRWKALVAWPIVRLRWLRNHLAGQGKDTTSLFQLGAFAAVFDATGSVLLVKRRDFPVWNLPGGKVRSDETPWAAAVRETQEETGLDISLRRLTGAYSKRARREIVLNFDADAFGGRIVPTAEGVRSDFFPLDALPDATLPKHVERIHDSAERRADVVFRIQDSPPGLTVLGF
jgi:8-oxo-dGTP diphosphatase